jgi:hypothetical protein
MLVLLQVANKKSFDQLLDVLQRFFSSVRKKVLNSDPSKDIWLNYREYALTKTTGGNALLLVLSRILEIHHDARVNFDKYLEPIVQIDFRKDVVAKAGGGWKGFGNVANSIIRKLRKHTGEDLKYYPKRKKR